MAENPRPGTNSAASTAPRYLEPDQVRIWRDEGGRVHVTIEGELTVLGARFVRLHPLTDPDRYLSILGPEPKGSEFGLLRHWQKLDREARAIVAEELDRRYLHPVVKSIRSLHDFFGTAIVTFETDRGLRETTLRDIQDNVVYLGQSRLLLTDAEGNRYDIPDVMALDAVRRALLAQIL
jgi:hypothetical protein